ncbi:MAG: hypothetical protein J5656_02810 [Clostridia bacterium]|nr:hypothetical protein [Clostridia bacterium]
MKELGTRCEAIKCGEAPMDFNYVAEQKLQLDDDSIVYAQIEWSFWGEDLYAISPCSYFENQPDLNKCIEAYDSLDASNASKYFDVFKKLDKKLENKVKETKEAVDDTKYNGGIRFGAKVNSKGLILYVEAVAYLKKENKYIYLQAQRNKGETTFSLTEKSIYMRMELDQMYDSYFSGNGPVPFLFESSNLDDLGEYSYMRADFEDLDKKLKEQESGLK